MGFKFRKSIKIAPGLKVNLGKTGASLSVGGKGATVNVSKRGVRGTAGIPGSGISYSENLSRRSTSSELSNSTNTSKGLSLFQWMLLLLFTLWVIHQVSP